MASNFYIVKFCGFGWKLNNKEFKLGTTQHILMTIQYPNGDYNEDYVLEFCLITWSDDVARSFFAHFKVQ
jgi:hypothetical protein